MRWTHLAALVLPFAVIAAGCAAESEDPTPVPAVDPSLADDGTDTDSQTDDLTAKPVYATVGPIVTANCGECHAPFKTLAGIKADKTGMIAKITAGSMPPGNPAWKKSKDGKLVLKWLKTGTDLK